MRANSTTEGNQALPTVAVLSTGRFIVVWNDDPPGNGPNSALGQLFYASGTPIGDAFPIGNIYSADGFEVRPIALALDQGGFAVYWPDGSDNMLRIYDGNAQPLTDGILVGEGKNEESFGIAQLADGTLVVAYDRSQPNGENSSSTVLVHRFDPDGTRIDDTITVTQLQGGGIENATISSLGDGGFVVSWYQYGTGFDDAAFRVYDQDGTPRTGPLTAEAGGVTAGYPSVSGLSDGNFVISWVQIVGPGDYEIVARRFEADGTPIGGRFIVDTGQIGIQHYPAVAALANGGFIVTWSSGTAEFDQFDAYAREYDAQGSAITAPYRINQSVDGNQVFAANQGTVAEFGDGTAVFAWSGSGQGDPEGAFFRFFTLQGGGGDLLLEGDAGDNALDGTAGDDTIRGLAGDDTLRGFDGNDDLSGGSGHDLLKGQDGSDMLAGGGGRDTLAGGGGDDVLSGGGGADVLRGNGGSDALDGDAGSDTLIGGGGDDVLSDRHGGDRLVGGRGDDVYVIADGDSIVVERDNGGVDTVRSEASYTLADNVERLILDDIASAGLRGVGNDLGNAISSLEGNDRLLGRGGDDTLIARGGRDTLIGGNGDDVLNGGNGGDVLLGGERADWLIGGNGADIFRFQDDSGFDTIADFEHGKDLINLADYREENGGDRLKMGDLLITRHGDDTRIQLDLDRDGVADVIDLDGDGHADAWHIDLTDTNPGSIAAADFVF